MTVRWRDTDHLERAVETAGGREAFAAGVRAMLDQARLDQARGRRPAEPRKRRDMTQAPVDGPTSGTSS